MPYPEIYRFTAHQAEPHAASIRMMFADELSDDALDAALAAMAQASSPYSLVQFRGLGGAMARVGDDATAFAHRERRYFVAIIGLWLDAAEDRRAARGLDRRALGADPPRGARRLRQLPGGRRAGARARGLPAGDLRAAGGDQAALRPDEPLPLQPERAAGGDGDGEPPAPGRSIAVTSRLTWRLPVREPPHPRFSRSGPSRTMTPRRLRWTIPPSIA